MSRERCPTCKRALARPIPRVRKKPRRVSVNRDPGYRRWIRGAEFCVIAGITDMDLDCDGVIDPAHTAHNNGLSSKGADSSCVPLCRFHHREYDSGRAAFEKKYSVDMKKIAAAHYAEFLKEKEK